jgi:hypothetical protein
MISSSSQAAMNDKYYYAPSVNSLSLQGKDVLRGQKSPIVDAIINNVKRVPSIFYLFCISEKKCGSREKSKHAK